MKMRCFVGGILLAICSSPSAFAIKESLGEIYFSKPECSDYLVNRMPGEKLGWTANNKAVYLNFAVHGDSTVISDALVDLQNGNSSKRFAAQIRKALKLEAQLAIELQKSKRILKELIENKAIAWVGIEFHPGEIDLKESFVGLRISAELMKDAGLDTEEIEKALLLFGGPILYLKSMEPHLFTQIDIVYLEDRALKCAHLNVIREMQRIVGGFGSKSEFDKLDKDCDAKTAERDLFAARQIFNQKHPGYVDYGIGHETGVRAELRRLHFSK